MTTLFELDTFNEVQLDQIGPARGWGVEDKLVGFVSAQPQDCISQSVFREND